VDVIIEIPAVSAEQAVMGMRRTFLRAFGRGPFARRIGRDAWTAFSAGLVHGVGIDSAVEMGRTAARQRNLRIMLVARWSERRLASTVAAAAARAAGTT